MNSNCSCDTHNGCLPLAHRTRIRATAQGVTVFEKVKLCIELIEIHFSSVFFILELLIPLCPNTLKSMVPGSRLSW
jgi:hypothetical protein